MEKLSVSNDIEIKVIMRKKKSLKSKKNLSYKTHFFYISKRILSIMKRVQMNRDERHLA